MCVVCVIELDMIMFLWGVSSQDGENFHSEECIVRTAVCQKAPLGLK